MGYRQIGSEKEGACSDGELASFAYFLVKRIGNDENTIDYARARDSISRGVDGNTPSAFLPPSSLP